MPEAYVSPLHTRILACAYMQSVAEGEGVLDHAFAILNGCCPVRMPVVEMCPMLVEIH